MNLYIESIEGGTYIAGFGEETAETLIKDKHSDSLQFQCINEIKHQVEGKDFEKVWLKQNTPYEEMCGLSIKQEALIIELDWH